MGDYDQSLQLCVIGWLVPSFQFILYCRNRKCHFIGLGRYKNLFRVIMEPQVIKIGCDVMDDNIVTCSCSATNKCGFFGLLHQFIGSDITLVTP
jgi:hypothetical protein